MLGQGEIDCSNIIIIGIEYLPALKKKLESKEIKEVETQFGGSILTCGQDKLAIIQWLQTLLRFKDIDFVKECNKLEISDLLLDLLDAYCMNSQLHIGVYNILHGALNSKLDEFIDTVKFV